MRKIKNSMYVHRLLHSTHIKSQIVAYHFSTRRRIRLWSLHPPITGWGRHRVLSYSWRGSASASRTEQRTGFGLVVRRQGWLSRIKNVIILDFFIYPMYPNLKLLQFPRWRGPWYPCPFLWGFCWHPSRACKSSSAASWCAGRKLGRDLEFMDSCQGQYIKICVALKLLFILAFFYIQV